MGGLRIKRVLTLSLGLVAWLVVPSPNAGAATLIVTTTADENGSGAGCALREAIRSANENTAVGGCSAGTVGPDAITVPAGTYGLSVGGLGEDAAAMGDLDITEDLTINGAGARTTTVNAGQLDRVFDVLPTVGTASMNDLTITGGKGKPSPSADSGGGIDVEDATLNLLRVHVTGNQSGEYGGGIHTQDGILNITDSALTGNSAPSDSGAIDHIDGSSALSTLTNVTISGNTSASYAGGIGVADDNPTTLNNVTIVGNTVTGAPTNYAGGIGAQDDPAKVVLRNSLVAGNTAPVSPDCEGAIGSEGKSLIGNSDGCSFFAQPGDQVGTGAAPIDPLLGPLADNGGPAPTHALLKSSPAVDAGGLGCPVADQRGAPRSACDIGAYELVLCGKVPANRIGTDAGDVLAGTASADGLLGFGGKDRLSGKAGKDSLCGGTGKDTLKGGGGKDLLRGEGGKDLCVGQAGRDKAKGCETEKSV